MKRVTVKVPAKIKGAEVKGPAISDGLEDLVIPMMGEIFIFQNGPSRAFTVVDNFFPIPPELVKNDCLRYYGEQRFSFTLELTTFDFFSSKCLEVPPVLGRKLSSLENKRKKAYDSLKAAMDNGDIVIKDGVFIKGDEKKLKEHNMVLIK